MIRNDLILIWSGLIRIRNDLIWIRNDLILIWSGLIRIWNDLIWTRGGMIRSGLIGNDLIWIWIRNDLIRNDLIWTRDGMIRSDLIRIRDDLIRIRNDLLPSDHDWIRIRNDLTGPRENPLPAAVESARTPRCCDDDHEVGHCGADHQRDRHPDGGDGARVMAREMARERAREMARGRARGAKSSPPCEVPSSRCPAGGGWRCAEVAAASPACGPTRPCPHTPRRCTNW